ncbi:hypothetical protein PEP31012_03580 [Pandoraea eparura]|uniref:Gp42 n=1 Tax=Pandoraea eparura TaxID=2508291 RepID=A0A5E4WWN9_9BURK|nr:hypothetical protein [Pandoraea eparura]VVE29247.1 hypothetical protein PEP31012_03580 [Pandoraea eparura]
MNDMQQAVNAAFANVIASGAIEKAIQERVTKTVNDLINDQISAHSDFGRQLRDHVKAALQVDFSHLGIPGYNDFLLKIIRGQVEAQLNSSVGKHVETQMTQLLAPAPAQIKLSELVAQFIKDNDESHYGCSCDGPEQITLVVEGSEIPRGYHRVYLDKEEGKSKYQCKVQLALTDEGEVYSITIDEEEVKKSLFVGPLYGFDLRIFQMHAAGTKIIVDGNEHTIDTHYPNREY